MFNFLFKRQKLGVSLDLKQVDYDGHVYKVSKVIRIPREVNYKYHLCLNKVRVSVEFIWTVDFGKSKKRAAFCNRCKKLFLKGIK
jgi:hypothetical protein